MIQLFLSSVIAEFVILNILSEISSDVTSTAQKITAALPDCGVYFLVTDLFYDQVVGAILIIYKLKDLVTFLLHASRNVLNRLAVVHVN